MRRWLAQQARLSMGPSVPMRHRVFLISCALAALLLFGINAWEGYRTQRQERFDNAASNAQKLLISFEDHALQQLDAADTYLRIARRLMRENSDWRSLQESLGAVRSTHAADFTGLMAITDRNGKVIFISESPQTPKVSLAERGYFKALKSDPHDRAIVDATRRGLITGKMQYRIIRPILKDGKFDGVIMLSLLPENLTRFYGNLSLGRRSVSTIITDDRLLIARSPAAAADAYEHPLPGAEELGSVVEQPSGQVRVRSPLDGEERQLFFAHLPDYPVIVMVGISDKDILETLADSRKHLLSELAGFSFATLLVTLLLLRLLGELYERRQAVWALQSLNKVHQVLSGSNQAVLRAMSEDGVYQAMCEAIVTHGGYRMAWVGLVQNDTERSIRPVASAGYVQGYLDLLTVSSAGGRGSSGPAGLSILTGKPQINPNFENNSSVGPWRQAALERGYRSSIGLPLKSTGENFGVLSIYSAKVDAFGPEEVTLFEELAEDLSHGVMALRLRRENDMMSGALVQAQKMQALGNLTGGIAHDFNNLLQVILSNLDLGLKVAQDATLSRYLKNAMQGAENGAKLTGQLLAFARRQPLKPEPLRLDALMEEMTSLLHRTLGSPIQIVAETAANLWTALADANQLRNAVLNLAINARDAMPDGGRLTIGLGNISIRDSRREMKPGDYVTLSISDTGSGMTAEVMAQAFDPFFTTKPEGAGTGLGLSMVYGFAKQSGGHVTIDSALGLGTTVTVYLPRTWRAEAVAAPENAAPPQGQGEIILLVEDDAGVRLSVHDQLVSLGYRVLTAASSNEGLDILASSEPIDLLFTDLVMPGLFNGRDLAVQGRSLRPGLKVLFTSGFAQASVLEQGHLDDGVTLLGKPYRLSQLAQSIRRAITSEPMRVLLVEDDEMVREAMVEILESNGYAVTAQASAVDALKSLGETPGFTAIIADKNLSSPMGKAMDGIDLLTAAHGSHPRAALVLITGENLPPDALNGLEAAVLHKPFHPRALMEVLSRSRD